MKKTWFVVLMLVLALLMLGIAGALAEEALGTYETWDEFGAYCYNCDENELITTCYYNDTKHWFVCPECNQTVWTEVHRAFCDDDSVCMVCQAAVTISEYVCPSEKRVLTHNRQYHWYACSNCGRADSEPSTHFSDCTTPAVCQECGADDIDISYVDHDYSEYAFDSTHHWQVCTICGSTSEHKTAHYRSCEQTACSVCYQEDVTFATIHHDIDWTSKYVKLNDTHCVRTCNDCGALDDEPSNHKGDCTDPDYCTYCRTQGFTVEYYHHYSELAYDSTHHWSVCTTCNQAYDKEQHETGCGLPGYCTTCEIEGVTAVVGWHGNDWMWDTFVPGHDSTYCWSECSLCGEKEAITRHATSNCTTPSVCQYCGSSGVSCETYHSFEIFDPSGGHYYIADAESDASGHWWNCTTCNTTVTRNHTFDAQSICTVCDYQKAEACTHPEASRTVVQAHNEHNYICGVCDALLYTEEHSATCLDPDVCHACGAELDDYYSPTHATTTKIAYDTTAHWEACTDCGEIADVSTVEKHLFIDYSCTICGYSAIENALGTFEYTMDSAWCSDCEVDVYTGIYTQTECWFACPECCQTIHKFGLHYASCDAPEVCVNCNATGVTISRLVHSDSVSQYDSTQHWEECSLCGEKADVTDHTLTTQWDDTQHWTGCTECDYVEGYKNYHTADCTNSGVCKNCGQSDVEIYEVLHDWSTLFNDTYHWTACTVCDEQSGYMSRHSSRIYVKVSATECGIGCEDCDYIRDTTYPHEAKCSAPTTCTYCDGTDIITDHLDHDYDQETYIKISETECGNPCLGCGEYDASYHTAYCSDPDTCHLCGATDVKIKYIDCQEWDDFHDESSHGSICVDCGKIDFLEAHYTEDCSTPNTCEICGATGVYCELEHEDSGYSYDQYYHWRTCSRCGVKTWYQQHNRYCTETSGVCWFCDATSDEVTIITMHSESSRAWVSISSTQHQQICSDCNEPIGQPANHLADCSAPTHCIQCGADNVTAEYSHDIDYSDDPEHNNTHHWYTCTKCGERADVERHYNWHDCTQPTACSYCDAVNVDTILYHAYDNFDMGEHTRDGHVFTSAVGHWWHCSRCGDETVYPHEFGKGSICEICQYTKPSISVRLPGDADNDGLVALTDALLTLHYSVDSSVPINVSNADVNADGKADLYDVLLLLQYSAGWNVVLQ